MPPLSQTQSRRGVRQRPLTKRVESCQKMAQTGPARAFPVGGLGHIGITNLA